MALTPAAMPSNAGAASDRKALRSATEADVTAQARDGSAVAFAELYRRHAAAATSTARYLLRDRHDADDVVSEAFAGVLSALHNGAGPRDENFRMYLLACVRNGCALRSRQRGRAVLRDPSDFDDHADKLEDPERFVESDAVTTAYSSLPDPWKRVLWLTEVEDRPMEEVAASMHLRKPAAAALSYRAHQGLAEAYLSQSVLSTDLTLTSCRTVAPRLAKYVRGHCRAGQRRTISSHLSDCAACTALADQLDTVNHDLRGLILAPVGLAALLDRSRIVNTSAVGHSAVVAKTAATHSVTGGAKSAVTNGARSLVHAWTLPVQVAALVGVSAVVFAPEIASTTSARPAEVASVTSGVSTIPNGPFAGTVSTSTSPQPVATRVAGVQQNLPSVVTITPTTNAVPDTFVASVVTEGPPSSAAAESSVPAALPPAAPLATVAAVVVPVVTVPRTVVPPVPLPAIVAPTVPLPVVTAPPVPLPVVTIPAIPVTAPVAPPVTTVAPTRPGVPGIALGSATSFAVLAKTAVTSTGATLITGDVGTIAGGVTGVAPTQLVAGGVLASVVSSTQAQSDVDATSLVIASRAPVIALPDVELAGRTLMPGTYSSGTLGLTGTVTFDAGGRPNAVFVVKAATTLITASGSNVVFINGAQACNVFWQVGTSATLGTFSRLGGTVIADVSITATTGVNIDGRLIARGGAITLDTTTLTVPACAATT